MERMDRVRRLAGTVWAVGGLLAMLIWSLTGPRDRASVITWIVTAFVIAAVAARASSARIAWWWGGPAGGGGHRGSPAGRGRRPLRPPGCTW